MPQFGKPTPATLLQRQRMANLMNLARVYRNWSVDEVAKHVGVQTVTYIDETNGWVVTKLDLELMEIGFVVNIAKALDWTVEQVIEVLMAKKA